MPPIDRKDPHHAVFTPLNHIIGYAEHLEDLACAEGRVEAAQDLRSISNAGRILLSVLRDTLDIADPAGMVRAEMVLDETAVEEVALSPIDDARLLIVDDNESNRDMLSRRLATRGYSVQVAASGVDALAAIAREPLDAILLDINMPGMSGLDVLSVIRQEHSVADLPVIMVTVRDSSGDVVEALRLGANDYVTKPVDLRVMLARIGTQMALKRANELVKTLNRQLTEAQEKIDSLGESSEAALRNVPAWAGAVANDLAKMIRAREIAVYAAKDGVLAALRETAVAAPTMEEATTALASRGSLRASGEMVFGAGGMSGAIFGALVVEGKDHAWSEPERQLMITFARQLGGVLELQQLRGQLEAEKQRNTAKRQDLLDRGLTLLELCPRCGRCFGSPISVCAIDGAELESRLIPFSIDGRYRLIRLLGSGGMGEVFRARDQRLERDVAVKVLRADRFSNATVRLRFEREARALAAIRHEGVVMIHDSGDLEDGSGFLVTELLVGWDLRSVLRLHGPASPGQVADLVRQSGLALHAAHDAGLIHRDIKPANLFLVARNPLFQVKLLDFGVARPIDFDPELTQRGMLVGTPAYMAPEVVAGNPVDIRSDIYSLAAVAYETLTGRAVTLKDGQRVWFDVLYGEPPVVSSLVSGVTADVDVLFRRMLAKDPSLRPTLDELLESIGALTQFENGHGWPDTLFVDVIEVSEEEPAEGSTEIATTAAALSTIPIAKPPSQQG